MTNAFGIYTTGKAKDDGTAGVSESIGFLLIFSIMILGVGLVTLYGYPLLLQQQKSADVQIMQKNMIVLQNDIKSLAYKTVPYTETSLKIGGGSLTVYNTSSAYSSRIKIYDTLGGGTTYVDRYYSGELRFVSVSEDSDISLQNGAVISRGNVESGSAMLSEPRWFYDAKTNTFVFNLIAVNSTRLFARAGVGTVQMKLGDMLDTKFSEFKFGAAPAPRPIYLDFTTGTPDYSTAWDNYFRNTLKMTWISSASGTTTYRLPLTWSGTDPETLVIKQIDVTVESL
jgi:hypothetical protein